jgi:hypothetical protein
VNVSEAKLAANRSNAQKSTGPRTQEGKDRSRANALKHGLCASACVPEDIESFQRRSSEFFDTLKPQNEIHTWMVDQVALCSIRIDRSQRMERRVRDKISLRAELTWDDDRKAEAEDTGRSLGKDPAAAVEALRRTSHGCEWLMTRWALLAHAADVQQGTWADDQKRLAFDLLATPYAFRPGRNPGTTIDLDGQVIDNGDDPAAVARREIALLKERREVVADLDEVQRALVSADLTNEGDPELRRLRRYESALHNKMKWCLKQITIQSPYRCPDPSLRPQWMAQPEPIPAPEPKTADEVAAESWVPGSFQPPFCLEPEEFPRPGRPHDIPAILAGRREKRFQKAEARRDKQRKKVDKLRA